MSCRSACICDLPEARPLPAPRPRVADHVHTGPIVVAIHGILTSTTRRSWCDEFEVWGWEQNPAVKIVKREYWSWPIPAINVWIRNNILARSLAEDILALAQVGANPISIVAHSNGADIALKTAHRLSSVGLKLGSLVLIGAACPGDILDAGIFPLVSGRGLGKAVAYSSKNDIVLCSPAIWPYGRLGHTGWMLGDAGFSDARIITRWFTPFTHNEYFSLKHREEIFDQIWRDCGLPYDVPLGGAK